MAPATKWACLLFVPVAVLMHCHDAFRPATSSEKKKADNGVRPAAPVENTEADNGVSTSQRVKDMVLRVKDQVHKCCERLASQTIIPESPTFAEVVGLVEYIEQAGTIFACKKTLPQEECIGDYRDEVKQLYKTPVKTFSDFINANNKLIEAIKTQHMAVPKIENLNAEQEPETATWTSAGIDEPALLKYILAFDLPVSLKGRRSQWCEQKRLPCVKPHRLPDRDVMTWARNKLTDISTETACSGDSVHGLVEVHNAFTITQTMNSKTPKELFDWLTRNVDSLELSNIFQVQARDEEGIYWPILETVLARIESRTSMLEQNGFTYVPSKVTFKDGEPDYKGAMDTLFDMDLYNFHDALVCYEEEKTKAAQLATAATRAIVNQLGYRDRVACKGTKGLHEVYTEELKLGRWFQQLYPGTRSTIFTVARLFGDYAFSQISPATCDCVKETTLLTNIQNSLAVLAKKKLLGKRWEYFSKYTYWVKDGNSFKH
mmetsp:Transcript_9843/g.25896  ORF Transcript_9843/g.25896 Transcript_9843/m.25896 type:complete len:489 (-) Transcript_9843:49-1515(-)|eukprot:CAMPEP_0117501878 /NCGR_PEP_ID=MMETSP0784-20121206/23528_1 /TAXON_ID=39447 /ORGANISM="" /LENGTH=488 /DNA_ID=CAMNT_0005297151 /DNA_START=48 /DNA_END=1514 /DNA_ORIENTATION=+